MAAWRAIAVAVAFAIFTVPANAKPIKRSHHQFASHRDADPRPGRWCMWWLRRHLKIPKSVFPKYEYNLARAGKHIGTNAGGPAVGVIVVWPHHIGIISGRDKNGWIVTSGNDGGAVRTRPRSVSNAIAFRLPPSRMAGL